MQRSHFLAVWNKKCPHESLKAWESCLAEFQNIGGGRHCQLHKLHSQLALWTNDPHVLDSKCVYRSGDESQGFVEFNAESQDVLIRTDDLGLGLFYYLETSDQIAFCSEFEPLLPLLDHFELNEEASIEFLEHGMTLGEKTLLKDLQMSAPGALLRLTPNGQSLWSRKSYRANPTAMNLEEAADHAYDLIKAHVRHLVDTQEVKSFAITGGADTRLILSCLNSLERQNFIFWFNTAHSDKVPKIRFDFEVVQMLETEFKLKIDTELFPAFAGPSPVQPPKNFQRISDDDYRNFTLTGMFGGEILGGQAHVALGLPAPSFENAAFCLQQFCRSFATSIYHSRDSLSEFDRLWRNPHSFFYTRRSVFWSVDLIKFVLSLPPEFYLNYRLYQKIYERKAPEFLKIPFHSPIAFGNPLFQFHPKPQHTSASASAQVDELKTPAHPLVQEALKNLDQNGLERNPNFNLRLRALNDFVKITLGL